MNTPIHTVFGAGQIGLILAQNLAEDGYAVRLIRRSAPGAPMPGITWMQGDATDPTFADRACLGASAVYNCTSPPYHQWATALVPLFNAIRDAAGRAGARLVVLDNLYMYGRPPEGPFTENTPMRPCSEKGALRAQLVEDLWAEHHAGRVRVTTGRASDFFGPNTPNSAIFRPRFFAQLLGGKAVDLLGDPDQPHSYSYAPDVARGLAVLGTRDEALGRAWHLPVAAQTSTRELVAQFAAAARQKARLRVIPTWLLKMVGFFVPLVRAVAEMIYQWETPFIVDDSDFRRVFAVEPTPLTEAIQKTLDHHQMARAT